jgi:hypothetical protein
MSLWSNTDANTSAPKFAVAGGLGVAGDGDVLYGNTTQDAFVTGEAIGVFGVTAGETVGTGNVASFTVLSAGDSAYGIPTVAITGANTTPATATVNVKVVGVTIRTAGIGYAAGNTFTPSGATGTTNAVITITSVDANGNVTGVNITTAGKYSAVPTANLNPFTSNTGSGTGFTANLRFGLESVTVNNKGYDYNQSTVVATASGNGLANSSIGVTLDGQEAVNRGAHTGWVLRTEGSGGRAGRVQIETLVAMGSMTGDGQDDTQFGGE